MSDDSSVGAPTGGEVAAVDGDAPTYDVAELVGLLADLVEDAFPDDIWIRGQVRNLRSRTRAGHVYFDLVAPAPAEKTPEAALPVVLFDWYRKIVNRILGSGAKGQMVDGVEVRIRGGLSVYKARGRLQLQMKAIDPAYTLSRLADQRDRLLGELATAGLLERNKSLPLPALPLRVGLVTSAGSAAEADFRDMLAASGIGWEILVADTPVQGFGSEQRIAEALELAEQHGAEVIALVRGGGARTELAPFDSAAVAHAVAARAVPVLTGIGHEIDRSVADIVAHTACNTPTACAAALVTHAGRFDRATLDLWRRIQSSVAGRLASDRDRLDGTARRTAAAARTSCGGARSEIRRLTLAIGRAAHHGAERTRLRLDGLEAQARAYDPQRALERGWSITTDGTGRLLRSVAGIMPGATLQTRMSDGTVTSIAEAVTPDDTTGSDHD